MAEDLADQIDDYICVFEGAGDLTMDTFVMLLFALIVVVISLVFATKLIYDKYVLKKGATATGGTADGVGTAATVPAGTATPLVSAGVTAGTRVSEPKEVLSKKEAILSQVRNGGSGGMGGGGGGARGGSGFGGGAMGAASGPTIARKRISRMSPGPEAQKKRPVIPPSNINGTDPQITQWAIHLFRWLYSDLVVVNKLLQDWVATVNTALLTHVEQHEMIVEVVRVLPESLPPNMSSILCEPTDQPNEVELLFDVDATPVLQIKAFKSSNQKTEVSHYKATVARLKSRVSVIVNYFALKGEMKLEGYPDIKIHLNSIGPLKTANAQDEKKQIDLITELLIGSMRDVVYPVDFSIYSTCPRIMGEESEEVTSDYGYGGYSDGYRGYQDDAYGTGLSASPRKLLVKVLKAEGLLKCSQPFCVIEMDEPAQKHQSASKLGQSPYWDETFLFDLSNHSTELLFEVYDTVAVGNDKSTSEPREGTAEDDATSDDPQQVPSAAVNMASTASMPDVVDSTTNTRSETSAELPPVDNGSDGVLATVAECPEASDATENDPVEPLTTKTTPTRTVDSGGDEPACTDTNQSKPRNASGGQKFLGLGLVGIDELASGPATTQILELQPRPYETETITGSLTVEFVFIDSPPVPAARRQYTQQSFHANGMSNFARDAVTSTPGPGSPGKTAANQAMVNGSQSSSPMSPSSPSKQLSNKAQAMAERNQRFQAAEANRMNNSFLKPTATGQLNSLNGMGKSESTPASPALSSTSATSQSMTASLSNSAPVSVNSAPPVKKPRNIFGTLRNKLTPSKKSKSLDVPQYSPTMPGGNVRSASSTLSRGSSIDQRSNIFRNLSRKSSISESSAISGLSTGSGRTYVHEESTLLLETTENNVVRHYLVPLEVATKQKNWKRKGTKLHIYNDHTFVAKHIPGGILCFVCNRSIPRRPGKQGYECRDCAIQCHKPCHVRAPQACPNPKILSMQLLRWPWTH
uniref:Phorbol-ester/DAG-type domain-containing protein n=1 Tax=Anopheles arabiensis TaxID=7173 RepID=A0A182HPU4_ANOAR